MNSGLSAADLSAAALPRTGTESPRQCRLGSRRRDRLRLLGPEHRQEPQRARPLRGRLGLRQERQGAEARAEIAIPPCS